MTIEMMLNFLDKDEPLRRLFLLKDVAFGAMETGCVGSRVSGIRENTGRNFAGTRRPRRTCRPPPGAAVQL